MLATMAPTTYHLLEIPDKGATIGRRRFRMSWKILVVDDAQDVHELARLALGTRRWRQREFEIRSAYSTEQGEELLCDRAFDVAVIGGILEPDDAGLRLCEFARAHLPAALRIVLLTKQPGTVSEEHVLETLDIDFCLTKSETTAQGLYKVIRASLRTLKGCAALEESNARLATANADLSRETEFRRRVLEQIGEGQNGLVSQLLRHASQLRDASPEDNQKTATALTDAAERVRHVLRPHDFRDDAERTLKDKTVLILLKNRRALRVTQGALAGTLAKPHMTSDWSEGLASLRAGKASLLYVDWANRDILREARQFNPNLLAILMTGQEEFEQHGEEMLALSAASALIVSPILGAHTSYEALGIQELVITAGKLISGDIFGLEKYLSWGVGVQEESLLRTIDRQAAIERLLSFARRCNVRSGLRQRLATLTDELLMNAMWDAPADEEGRPRYNHLTRGQPLELREHEAVLLRYASDGNRLAVSVTDRFGRLDRETAFGYVRRCLVGDFDASPTTSGGAGLGLYMAYMAMSNLVINVRPGEKTEVIGFWDLTSRLHDPMARPRCFHYFSARTIRRAHPRKNATLEVRIARPNGTILEPQVVRNISLGGLFIQMDDPLPVGELVELNLALKLTNPPPHVVRCIGRVVWRADVDGQTPRAMRGIGVKMEGLNETEMRLIADYLERQPGVPEA